MNQTCCPVVNISALFTTAYGFAIPEMPGRDQVYPAALIALERRCQLAATADEESPLEDFARNFLLRVRPGQRCENEQQKRFFSSSPKHRFSPFSPCQAVFQNPMMLNPQST
jgi:hypothetical protein